MCIEWISRRGLFFPSPYRNFSKKSDLFFPISFNYTARGQLFSFVVSKMSKAIGRNRPIFLEQKIRKFDRLEYIQSSELIQKKWSVSHLSNRHNLTNLLIFNQKQPFLASFADTPKMGGKFFFINSGSYRTVSDFLNLSRYQCSSTGKS